MYAQVAMNTASATSSHPMSKKAIGLRTIAAAHPIVSAWNDLDRIGFFYLRGAGAERTAVVDLLSLRGPSAVVWAVTRIIIDAIQRKNGPPTGEAVTRSRPHIREEVGKGAACSHVPTVTDRNAAPAIVAKESVMSVIAAGDHAAPREVLATSRAITVRELAMSSHLPDLAHGVADKTPTTFNMARSKPLTFGNNQRSAFTAATPKDKSLFASSSLNFSGQPAVDRACNSSRWWQWRECVGSLSLRIVEAAQSTRSMIPNQARAPFRGAHFGSVLSHRVISGVMRREGLTSPPHHFTRFQAEEYAQ